jgi:hypothetical protein
MTEVFFWSEVLIRNHCTVELGRCVRLTTISQSGCDPLQRPSSYDNFLKEKYSKNHWKYSKNHLRKMTTQSLLHRESFVWDETSVSNTCYCHPVTTQGLPLRTLSFGQRWPALSPRKRMPPRVSSSLSRWAGWDSVRTHHRDEAWSASLWQSVTDILFHSHGCPVWDPSDCGETPHGLWFQEVSDRPSWWSSFHVYYPLGCQEGPRLGGWPDLFHTTHKANFATQLVARIRGSTMWMPLVLDLRITHDRFGSSADPNLNGQLHYPNNIMIGH